MEESHWYGSESAVLFCSPRQICERDVRQARRKLEFVDLDVPSCRQATGWQPVVGV